MKQPILASQRRVVIGQLRAQGLGLAAISRQLGITWQTAKDLARSHDVVVAYGFGCPHPFHALPMRAIYCLRNAGVQTLEEARSALETGKLHIPGFGDGTRAEIRAAIAAATPAPAPR